MADSFTAALRALDAVRLAVLTGQLERLGQLAEGVDHAFADLPRPLDAQAADALRIKAAENARLLQASQRGLRAAQRRMAELRGQSTLSTYDRSGRREALSPSQTADHRA